MNLSYVEENDFFLISIHYPIILDDIGPPGLKRMLIPYIIIIFCVTTNV